MKRLKLFENFKQDWLNKISELKNEAENEALSKIQEFFYDLTDDFDNDEVHSEIPDYTPIVFSDSALEELFFYPESLEDFCDQEGCDFWQEVIPNLFRIRERKRDLYADMGFKFF